MKQIDLKLLQHYALSFVGTKYTFGTAEGSGDDPVFGFDCSGLASEILRASGIVPYNYRARAQDIYALLSSKAAIVSRPAEYAFAFYGPSQKEINHIAWCLSDVLMLEAGGGDQTTVNETTAAVRNAFVRIRPALYRKDYLGCLLLKEWAPN